MSRDTLQTITLPILIPSGSASPDGAFGTLIGGESITNVMALTPLDVRGDFQKQLKAEDREIARGLDLLKYAYEREDLGQLEKAALKLEPHVAGISRGLIHRPSTAKLWELVRWHYTSVMSTCVDEARLVMWFAKKKKFDSLMAPAIYCPNRKTAVFVAGFLSLVRVCPKCHKPFVPDAGNVAFCTPAHGVAYRTARSRANKKARMEVPPS